MIDTPVLFLIFNRPETTAQVFEAIRQAKPKQLFVAADGPRENNSGDIEKCKLAREIVSQVDWECDLKTLYREKNLGCKYAISSAIDWFFDNVGEGIILEDDTLPNQSFFSFCQELLNYYRYDESVKHISGFNAQTKIEQITSSYYFSNYPHIWGWATWKKAWQFYNVELKDWPEIRKKSSFRHQFISRKEYNYWKAVFNDVYFYKLNTWDIQWLFTLRINNWLSVTPKVNLVKNIGIGLADATHTNSSNPLLSNVQEYTLEPNLSHPNVVEINLSADNFLFENIFYKWKKTFSLKQFFHDNLYIHLPEEIKNKYRKLKIIK